MSRIIESTIIKSEGIENIMTKENIQNASALLALLHGKSDSICKVFIRKLL